MLLLEGQPRSDSRPPRAPLPLFARELLERLPRFGGPLKDAAGFHDQLAATRDRAGRVLPAVRGPLLALVAFLAVVPSIGFLVLLLVIAFFSVRNLESTADQTITLLVERRQEEAATLAALVLPYSHPLPRLLGTRALADQFKLTSHLEERVAQARRYIAQRRSYMGRGDRVLFDFGVVIFPPPGPEELDEKAPLHQRSEGAWFHLEIKEGSGIPLYPQLPLLLGFPALCVFAALVFRGGLRHYLLGVRLVRRDGRRAGRLRCAWRALVAWLPLVPLGFWIFLQECTWRPRIVYLGDLCWLATGLLAVLSIALMLRTPARSLHDRLAGTWLVPR